MLEIAQFAVDPGMVPEARAARRNGLLEHRADRGDESLRANGTDGGRVPARREMRPMERFRDIDIAEPGDESLIHQRRLESRSPPRKSGAQMIGRKHLAQGLGTEIAEQGVRLEPVRFGEREKPEAAGVVEHQPLAGVGREHDMVMRTGSIVIGAGAHQADAPGHAEMEDQHRSAGRRNERVFAATGDRGHASTLEPGREIARNRAPEIAPADGDPLQATPQEVRPQAAAYGLHFRQFRHPRHSSFPRIAMLASGVLIRYGPPAPFHGTTRMSSTPEPGSGTAQFGSRLVPESEKGRLVRGVFESVADRYDLMNDLMSGGLHRLWKASLVDSLAPRPGMRLIDVAGGTGDIAFRFLRASAGGGHVTVVDINEAMLGVGRRRLARAPIPGEIEWLCGDAEALPVADRRFDAYTIAFGIRNVTHRDRALAEARRVLAYGGQFLCLEFCPRLALPLLDRLYDRYSERVIPALGRWIAGDAGSYVYLVESIRRFPPPEAFAEEIAGAGFDRVGYRLLSGGVCAIHSAWKI